MPLTHIVNRSFEGAGLVRQTGECVDTTTWRWTQQLESQGRISPIPATVEPVQTSDGRFWTDSRTAESHEAKLAEASGQYPVRLERGKYLLSDGTVVKGSQATAEAHEDELHAMKE